MSGRHGPAAAARADTPSDRTTAESILEQMPVAFLSADRDLRLAYANRAAERLMRSFRDDLVGTDLREVFPQAPGREFHAAALPRCGSRLRWSWRSTTRSR